jgi:hypothetical protein
MLYIILLKCGKRPTMRLSGLTALLNGLLGAISAMAKQGSVDSSRGLGLYKSYFHYLGMDVSEK